MSTLYDTTEHMTLDKRIFCKKKADVQSVLLQTGCSRYIFLTVCPTSYRFCFQTSQFFSALDSAKHSWLKSLGSPIFFSLKCQGFGD